MKKYEHFNNKAIKKNNNKLWQQKLLMRYAIHVILVWIMITSNTLSMC
jgi:hypothetical protein